jgi:asparagine synthase (glutamine-hydrolysing)
MPTSVKIRDGDPKWVLKEAVKDLLPADHIRRKKVGFNVPVVKWFTDPLAGFAREVLLDGGPEAVRWFHRPYIERMLEIQREGKGNYGFRIWVLVNYVLWHRYWIEGKSI